MVGTCWFSILASEYLSRRDIVFLDCKLWKRIILFTFMLLLKCLVVRFFRLSLFIAVEMLLLTAYPSRIPLGSPSVYCWCPWCSSWSFSVVVVVFCCFCCCFSEILFLFYCCCCFVCFFVSFRCLVHNVAYVHECPFLIVSSYRVTCTIKTLQNTQ